MSHYWVSIAVELLSRVLMLLPFSVLHRLAHFAGDIAYWVMVSRRKIVLDNLQKVYGDSLTNRQKRQIARRSFQNMILSLVELFVIPKMLKEASSRFRFVNFPVLEEEFRRGKGVLLVISHLGSWEYLAFLPYLKKMKWSVVVRDIKNPHVDRAVNRLRRMTQLQPIPRKASAKRIVRELKHNHGVAVLIDQWAGPEGVWQEFFGHETSTTSIPARLALKLGCSLVPAYCIRTGPGFYTIEFQTPVSVESKGETEITRAINALLEMQIRKYPDQWLWMHRRWKAMPSVIRK
ncbi:MAG: lysophospholipid acyltransferase family protein [Candidatus Omnitrophica bacterium]|nr:lysophospholipid acyltransferase family protein [Candidatus Omnitrophota bacterium]